LQNQDGTITLIELRKILRDTEAITDKELEEIINEVDTNADGKVDFEEFIIMMRSSNRIC
jgi:Ca2+-binding EF-hand superfamily protein